MTQTEVPRCTDCGERLPVLDVDRAGLLACPGCDVQYRSINGRFINLLGLSRGDGHDLDPQLRRLSRQAGIPAETLQKGLSLESTRETGQTANLCTDCGARLTLVGVNGQGEISCDGCGERYTLSDGGQFVKLVNLSAGSEDGQSALLRRIGRLAGVNPDGTRMAYSATM